MKSIVKFILLIEVLFDGKRETLGLLEIDYLRKKQTLGIEEQNLQLKCVLTNN